MCSTIILKKTAALGTKMFEFLVMCLEQYAITIILLHCLQ